MPSEYSPGGSKPRMSQAQIKKLQEDQAKARRVAEEKIAAVKNSDEWKREQKILIELEEKLKAPKIEGIIIEETQVKEKQKTFWEKISTFIKTFSK